MGALTYSTEEVQAILDKANAQVKPVPNVGKGINLLDNWYFIGGGSQQGGGQFPINQRGQTSYNSTGYTIDRWNILSGSSITIDTDSIVFSVSAGAQTNTKQLMHTIGNQVRSGDVLTISILVKSVTGNMNARLRFTNAGGSYVNQLLMDTLQPGLNSISGEVPDGATNVRLEIRNSDDSACSVSLVAVKLELGSEQTLARNIGTDANPNWVLNDPPPNFQQELNKCYRYFVRYGDPQRFIGVAAIGTTGSLQGVVFTPESLRANPQITGTIMFYNSLINSEVTSVTVQGIGATAVRLNGNVAGVSSVQQGMLYSISALVFSADL